MSEEKFIESVIENIYNTSKKLLVQDEINSFTVLIEILKQQINILNIDIEKITLLKLKKNDKNKVLSIVTEQGGQLLMIVVNQIIEFIDQNTNKLIEYNQTNDFTQEQKHHIREKIKKWIDTIKDVNNKDIKFLENYFVIVNRELEVIYDKLNSIQNTLV